MDDDFRIKITDFGTGKILETGGKSKGINTSVCYLLQCSVERAETWVGTAQYIAPELLEAKETSRGYVSPFLCSQVLTSLVAPISGLLAV